MGATSPRCAETGPRYGAHGRAVATLAHRALVAASALACLHAGAAAGPPLRDEPVLWWDDDRTTIAEPAERDPNVIWDSVEDTFLYPVERFLDPVRAVRRVGTAFGGDHVRAAADVNALGEVVNSTWFTNRIGLFPMTVDEVVRGSGSGQGPDRSAPWTVVSAKTEGVTPGFNIRDARGDLFLIKFDPPGCLGMTTCAGVISARLLHAAGYHVPDDATVTFRREDLVLGDNVRLRLADGSRRAMTEEDLDAILSSVDRLPSGEWFAISSRFLAGTPVGPFDYLGRRRDDPNDRIPHEDRRSLRGLEVVASWINHFDTKQHNSLDMYVEEDGRRFLRHYLIDFASTLGSGAKGAQPRHGYEYTLDLPAIGGRLVSLGFHESIWRTRTRPDGLSEVGYFDATTYDPIEFKPIQPNSAFANCTGEDGYWAAKIVTAFTDAHLEAVVKAAGYRDPRAAEHVASVLAARRDAIGREFFDQVPPLDFFRLDGERIVFHDLGAERGIYPRDGSRYRFRLAWFDADRSPSGWTPWIESSMTEVDWNGMGRGDAGIPFLGLEAQVTRGSGWSRTVRAFFSPASGRTLAVER